MRNLMSVAALFGDYCLLFGRRIFPSELLTAVLSGVIISIEGWASGTLSKARGFSTVSDVSERVMSCLSATHLRACPSFLFDIHTLNSSLFWTRLYTAVPVI